jgi:hypothetical protein
LPAAWVWLQGNITEPDTKNEGEKYGSTNSATRGFRLFGEKEFSQIKGARSWRAGGDSAAS